MEFLKIRILETYPRGFEIDAIVLANSQFKVMITFVHRNDKHIDALPPDTGCTCNCRGLCTVPSCVIIRLLVLQTLV